MERLTIDEIIGHCERKTEQFELFFEKERLETTPLISSTIKEHWEHKQVAEYLKKLKEYQQLEEQGRLIKLPCKIGTEVYNTTWWDDVQEKVKVAGKTYYRTVHKHKVSKSTFGYYDIENFGETVFLTKSEAEAKLKELGGGEVAPKMDTKVANKENVISFFKKRFQNKIQMFDTRNFVGDHMITIYDSNGVVIDYCPDYDYIEIFGLTDDEFAIVVEECGDN